jgi:hypothetical protein
LVQRRRSIVLPFLSAQNPRYAAVTLYASIRETSHSNFGPLLAILAEAFVVFLTLAKK